MKYLHKPNVSEDLAVQLAKNLYGFEVTSIHKLISFDDQNFHLKVEEKHTNPFLSKVDENGYTLKITNTAKTSTRNHFESMHCAMQHLNAKNVRCPVPVPTVEGKWWRTELVPTRSQGNPLEACGIHLLTYISGDTVSTVSYSKEILFQWGQLIAKIHTAFEDMEDIDHEDAHFEWNLEHVPDIEKYLNILDVEKEALVRRILQRYKEQIVTNLQKLPRGVIHGDCNEYNVLVVKTKDSCAVDGILDFEDIHNGTYVWDVGVAMAYTLLDCTTMHPLEGAGHLLAGYLSLRRLSNLEFRLLKVCIESRLSQSLVLCTESYRKDPSNTYLLSTPNKGWPKLAQLDAVSEEELLANWRKIILSYNIVM